MKTKHFATGQRFHIANDLDCDIVLGQPFLSTLSVFHNRIMRFNKLQGGQDHAKDTLWVPWYEEPDPGDDSE